MRGRRFIQGPREFLANIWATARYMAGQMAGPRWLYLEVVNICNADCIFCAYRHDKRPKRRLGLDVITKAATEYKDLGGTNVSFSPTLGETFADKYSVQKIEAVRDIGFDWIHTYTNASLFHKFGVENILRSGLTEIRISLAPPDEALYRRMYQNDTYQDVMNNIRDLLVAFQTLSDKTVRDVFIEFRADRDLAACQALPDYQSYIAPHAGPGVHINAMTHFDGWSGAITEADLLPGMTMLEADKVGSKRLPCGRIFALQVLSDGTIRQCGCRVDTSVEKDELVLGHIDEMTLQEAFHSPKARRNVASFVKGNPIEVCRKCSWYHPGL
jgi:sulfatase maturation enzyme AslB (radical SAM superfamily)